MGRDDALPLVTSGSRVGRRHLALGPGLTPALPVPGWPASSRGLSMHRAVATEVGIEAGVRTPTRAGLAADTGCPAGALGSLGGSWQKLSRTPPRKDVGLFLCPQKPSGVTAGIPESGLCPSVGSRMLSPRTCLSLALSGTFCTHVLDQDTAVAL